MRELLDTVIEDQPAAGPVPMAWAPVDVCTLPTAEQPLREAEFDVLFAAALHTVERPEPKWLRLSFDGGAATAVRELTARESSCCSLFDFRLTAAAGALTLDVWVPDARVDVLDGLARRADAARAGAGRGSGAIA